MSSEPPDEPHQRSEPNTLSPASPKPIHFPTPAHIPVLEMQMDVGFNQTEPHMSDPAMHNTELRADCWRDPDEVDTERKDAEPNEGSHTVTNHPSQAASAVKADTQQEVDGSLSNDSPISGQKTEPSQTQSTSPEPLTIYNGHAPLPNSANGGTPHTVPSTSANAEHTVGSQTTGLGQTGIVDFQFLLDSLQTSRSTPAGSASVSNGLTVATGTNPSTSSVTPVATSNEVSSPLSAAALTALSPTGLPARPPPQEQPLIHPNYVHSQHLRDYHPHAAHSAYQPHSRTDSQGNIVETHVAEDAQPSPLPSASNAPPPSVSANAMSPHADAPGANGNSDAPRFNFDSTTANPAFGAASGARHAHHLSQTSTPVESRRESALAGGEQLKPEDRPWTAEIQRKYDRFLDDERRYVSEGRWEQFAQGSRLFVGNLSSERVTKRDIFHVFHIYGELAQISIKQAYGFVQFLRPEDCAVALEMEQGSPIRDKKIHLEISKPQKNRGQPARARSRSPDHGRGGKNSSNVDRYISDHRRGGGRSGGGRGSGGGSSMRSPSPVRGYRDRHDDRHSRRRSRSRSRTPPYRRGGGGGGGGRNRSPTPRRDTDDDLPLPERDPRDVPDVQIIVLDQLDRDFISWVEGAFAARGVRVDVLLLSPRLSEQAVIRRQIVEGVLAVCKLTRHNQNSGKIGLQIFNRQGGANNVTFEEYDNLDPPVCVELVLRAKQTQASFNTYGGNGGSGGLYGRQQQYSGQGQPQQQPYSYGNQAPAPPNPYAQQSYPQQPYPQSQVPPRTAPSVPPNLQHLITSLDSSALQNLLSAMNPQSGGNASSPYPGSAATPTTPALSALQNNPAIAQYLQQQAPNPSHQQQHPHPHQQPSQISPSSGSGGGPQVNMQEILARLGTYKQ